MEMIKLRNGSEEPAVLVTAVVSSLRGLMSGDADISVELALFALVELSRDPNYQLWDSDKETLRKLGLADSKGGVNDSIRNIVQCALVGRGRELRLVSPVADSEGGR